MSTKLDQSLDEILKDQKAQKRRTRNTKPGPTGGVKKRSARLETKQQQRGAPAAAAAKSAKKEKNDTKIVVSNLPVDVTDAMIKDYFTGVVGPVKKAHIAYTATGKSSGVATIEFVKPGHANHAFEQYNGRLVDNRPMKVELVVDPSKVSLSERIGAAPAPKAAPRSAAASKPRPVTASKNGANGAKPGRGGKKAAGPGRGGKARSGSGFKKSNKTVEQLDQEMDDYYKPNENAAPAPAASAADAAAMEDL